MGLKEENLRLKLALLDMVRQFYEYIILTPEIAEKYNVLLFSYVPICW